MQLPNSKLEILNTGHVVWEDDAAAYASLVTSWWSGGYAQEHDQSYVRANVALLTPERSLPGAARPIGRPRHSPSAAAEQRRTARLRASARSPSCARELFRGLLLSYRGRTGLIQRDLAARAGVSERSIQDWEAGLTVPTAARLQALIGALLDANGLTPGHESAEAREFWTAAEPRRAADAYSVRRTMVRRVAGGTYFSNTHTQT